MKIRIKLKRKVTNKNRANFSLLVTSKRTKATRKERRLRVMAVSIFNRTIKERENKSKERRVTAVSSVSFLQICFVKRKRRERTK